jgi:hypothetical protein
VEEASRIFKADPVATQDSSLTSFTVSVFTHHSADCSKTGNPQWQRCKSRKSLYIYEGGKKKVITAKTRS